MRLLDSVIRNMICSKHMQEVTLTQYLIICSRQMTLETDSYLPPLLALILLVLDFVLLFVVVVLLF